MNAKQRIVALVKEDYDRKRGNLQKALSDRAATHTGRKVWDEFNRDDGVGGISQNPYNTSLADSRANEAEIAFSDARDAYDLAVNTFLEVPHDRG